MASQETSPDRSRRTRRNKRNNRAVVKDTEPEEQTTSLEIGHLPIMDPSLPPKILWTPSPPLNEFTSRALITPRSQGPYTDERFMHPLRFIPNAPDTSVAANTFYPQYNSFGLAYLCVKTEKLDLRTIVISVDGSALVKYGNPSTIPRASYGVYFGDSSSKNNLSGPVPAHLPQTSQFAEMYAVYKALLWAHQSIEDPSGVLRRRGTTRRIIIVTDTKYVLDALLLHKDRFRQRHKELPIFRKGHIERGGDKEKRVLEQVYQDWLTYAVAVLAGALECAKKPKPVKVMFWWVPREQNCGADYLARKALWATIPSKPPADENQYVPYVMKHSYSCRFSGSPLLDIDGGMCIAAQTAMYMFNFS